MKFKILILATTFLFTACSKIHKKGIQVNIENNSKQAITGLTVRTSEHFASANYPKIAAQSDANGFLDMGQNKTDGSYEITFTRKNGKKEVLNAGYYTNGGSLESQINIDIKPDTTIITFSGLIY